MVLVPRTGTEYIMRIISKRVLREFWSSCPDAKRPLLAWYQETVEADWGGPAAVKQKYRSASFVGDRVVFNIKGNDYRLVVWINYPYRVVYIRFVGTHSDYDAVDVGTV